ncbi:acyl-CoA dehydrogenase family protein [Embleya sp. NPDC020630]|uniref:acyl-CoA dehydrogenase family protein n=1 Tax=Embleya sp. NPDC020630 TaxID=3363979 RepID=UPI0037BC4810
MHVSRRDEVEGFAGTEGLAGGGMSADAEDLTGDEGFAEVAAGLIARHWGGAATAPTGDLDRLWEMGAGHGWFDLGREDDLAASITLARVLGRAACPLPVSAGFVAARLFAEHVGLATAIGDGGVRVATALPGDPGLPGAGCLVEAGDVASHVLQLPPGGGPMGLHRIEAVDPVEDLAVPGWTRARLGSALAYLELSAAEADRAVTVLRLGWAARALGAAERVAGAALAHARVRTRAGEPVGAFAAVRQRADRMELGAGDLLIADAVRRYAEGAGDWAIAAELAVAQIRRVAPRVRFGAHHEPAVAGCSDEHETPWLFHRVRADLACLRAFAAPGGDAADRLLEETPSGDTAAGPAAHGTGVRTPTLPDPWLGPDGEAVREACRKVASGRWGPTASAAGSGSEGAPDTGSGSERGTEPKREPGSEEAELESESEPHSTPRRQTGSESGSEATNAAAYASGSATPSLLSASQDPATASAAPVSAAPTSVSGAPPSAASASASGVSDSAAGAFGRGAFVRSGFGGVGGGCFAASADGEGVDDPAVVAEAAGHGWFALGWSGADGGGGVTAAERFALRQEVCRLRLPILDALTTATVFGPAIARYGSARQRARLLPALREGTIRIALGYRWSEADFDPAAVRASAVRTGAGERDDWILTGARIWTADAHRADRMWLVARTDGDVESPRAGLTVFLVPTDAPGVLLRPHRSPAGERGCIVLLDEVRVSDSARIGTVGGGWAPVAETFVAEPILLGDVAATLHRRLTDLIGLLRAGAGTRPVAGARGSAARAAVAELAVRTQAVRLLATAAAVPAPGGRAEHPRLHASAARVLGAELAADFGPIGLELLGPAAVLGAGAPGAPGAGGFEPELWPAPHYTPAGDTDDLHHDLLAHSLGLPARV